MPTPLGASANRCGSRELRGGSTWRGGLEHGDEWDGKIRQQIKECVLFIPLISANPQARHEGYFRIEWELAAERAMGIAHGVPFILPIVIDDTREPEALVPDRFRKVQWMRLPGGIVSPEVQARLLRLWSHRTGAISHEEVRKAVADELTADSRRQRRRSRPPRRAGAVTAACSGAAMRRAVQLESGETTWPEQRPARSCRHQNSV